MQRHVLSRLIPADPPDPFESPEIEVSTPTPVPGLYEATCTPGRIPEVDWSLVCDVSSGKDTGIMPLALL